MWVGNILMVSTVFLFTYLLLRIDMTIHIEGVMNNFSLISKMAIIVKAHICKMLYTISAFGLLLKNGV